MISVFKWFGVVVKWLAIFRKEDRPGLTGGTPVSRFRPLGIFVAVIWGIWGGAPARAEDQRQADLLIVGATESGWAAAIQAARMGVEKIVMVHDGVWYGGQFTEQALACVDENKGTGKVGWGVDWHPMKRSFHRSGLFKELMDGIEALNEEKYGAPMPGKPYHGPSTFRPAEAESVFRKMISPYVDSGQIEVFWRRCPVRVGVAANRVTEVEFAALAEDGVTLGDRDLVVKSRMTIDASDWGEVIQLSGAAYECGPDPQSRYGEPSAPLDMANFPRNEMNPITWAMIVEQSPNGEESPIPEPARFDDRNYPRATHFSRKAFGGLKWDVKNPGMGAIDHWPADGEASKRQLSVYSVRRIVDGYDSKDGLTSILLNYMNGQDYPLERLPAHVVEALEATEPGAAEKNIVEMTRAQRAIVFADARRHSLGVLYHLQNFVHQRAEQRQNSFRHFRLSGEFGTDDSLPPKPYIREGLRLKAMYMMREQDARNTDGVTKEKARERFAQVMYPDGLFAWQFHYDFHRTGRTYLEEEGAGGPWIDYHKNNRHTNFLSDRSLFPMRSLIPETMDGLLGAQGNVGYSSIVSAAIRLHDQRVHVGQAAGATAAVSLLEKVKPREMVYDRGLLEKVRDGLCSEEMVGVPLLLWPWRDLPADHPAFVAVNRLSAMGFLPEDSEPTDVDILSGESLRDADGLALLTEKFGDQAVDVWTGATAIVARDERKAADDYDGDGIADRDDALLFTPNEPVVWAVRQVPVTPATDGMPEEVSDGEQRFDFGPDSGKPAKAWQRDSGGLFNEERGYGWRADLSGNLRRRNAVEEAWRDSFLFTRKQDVWECSLEKGSYLVTCCVGDSGYPQPGQNVAVEGHALVTDQSTATGEWLEAEAVVEVTDGRLTVAIGSDSGGGNTCLNWLTIRKLPAGKR